MQLFGHNRRGPKIWGLRPFLGKGRAGSPSNTVAWAEAYLHNKWHLDASSRLATIKWAENGGSGGSGGQLGPHPTQCHLGRGLPLYEVAS